MGKESELFHAVKNAEVSTIRKFLVKFKSGPKGSMYTFFVHFFLNEHKPGNFWKIKNKAETEALL